MSIRAGLAAENFPPLGKKKKKREKEKENKIKRRNISHVTGSCLEVISDNRLRAGSFALECLRKD